MKDANKRKAEEEHKQKSVHTALCPAKAPKEIDRISAHRNANKDDCEVQDAMMVNVQHHAESVSTVLKTANGS